MKESLVLSKDFPKKLRQLRKQKEWSQGQLAKKIKADIDRVSKYERGVMWPTMEIMVRIAIVFGVSVDYLIRDTKNVAINKISNQELLEQMEEVNQLSQEDQTILVALLDAFIKRRKFEKLALS